MEGKGFVFDYSRCVGCHACLVACYNENHTQPPISWRQVQAQNKLKVPLAGFINLSIACNHCVDAPCLNACPAKAYHKDSITGAIVHTAEKCIGCTYCTWACPFDAPQYNQNKGVVEKCNFCNDRLIDGLIPACTNSCPTGALSFGCIEIYAKSDAPGMSSKATSPRINFKNVDVLKSTPIIDIGVTGFDSQKAEIFSSTKPKIDAFKEWPLVIFTFISSLLVGWVVYLLFNSTNVRYGYLFAALGILGMVLSSLHLGKPFRAYRSILNYKTSWLSREIIFFSVFIALSLIIFFVNSSLPIIAISVALGLILLISIEFVYSIADKNYSTQIHSANTILTALAFGSILLNFTSLTIGLLVLKGILYVVRYAKGDITGIRSLIGLVRFFAGIITPLVGIMILGVTEIAIVVPFIIGELIDRFEFYSNLHVDTPKYLLNNFNH